MTAIKNIQRSFQSPLFQFIRTTVALVSIALGLTSCATTQTQKILRDMAIAGAVGIAVAQTRSENKMAYGLMYGGLSAAGAGAAGLYIHNPEGRSEKLENENAEMKRKLDEAFAPKLESKSPGTMGGKIPDKYKRLVNPGEWRVYAIDQWMEDGENRLVHQDKIMELVPPSLVPQ